MECLSEGLDPSVASLDGVRATDALRREQHVPVLLTVRQALFQVEGRVAERLLAVRADEARRMPLLLERVQTVLNVFSSLSSERRLSRTYRDDRFGALGASGSNMAFEATLAVFSSAFLNKSTLKQTATTGRIRADEVLGAPR